MISNLVIKTMGGLKFRTLAVVKRRLHNGEAICKRYAGAGDKQRVAKVRYELAGEGKDLIKLQLEPRYWITASSRDPQSYPLADWPKSLFSKNKYYARDLFVPLSTVMKAKLEALDDQSLKKKIEEFRGFLRLAKATQDSRPLNVERKETSNRKSPPEFELQEEEKEEPLVECGGEHAAGKITQFEDNAKRGNTNDAFPRTAPGISRLNLIHSLVSPKPQSDEPPYFIFSKKLSLETMKKDVRMQENVKTESRVPCIALFEDGVAPEHPRVLTLPWKKRTVNGPRFLGVKEVRPFRVVGNTFKLPFRVEVKDQNVALEEALKKVLTLNKTSQIREKASKNFPSVLAKKFRKVKWRKNPDSFNSALSTPSKLSMRVHYRPLRGSLSDINESFTAPVRSSRRERWLFTWGKSKDGRRITDIAKVGLSNNEENKAAKEGREIKKNSKSHPALLGMKKMSRKMFSTKKYSAKLKKLLAASRKPFNSGLIKVPITKGELPAEPTPINRRVQDVITSIDTSHVIIQKDFYISDKIIRKIKQEKSKKEIKEKKKARAKNICEALEAVLLDRAMNFKLGESFSNELKPLKASSTDGVNAAIRMTGREYREGLNWELYTSENPSLNFKRQIFNDKLPPSERGDNAQLEAKPDNTRSKVSEIAGKKEVSKKVEKKNDVEKKEESGFLARMKDIYLNHPDMPEGSTLKADVGKHSSLMIKRPNYNLSQYRKSHVPGSASSASTNRSTVGVTTKTVITSKRTDDQVDIEVMETKKFVDKRLPVPFTTETVFQLTGKPETFQDSVSVLELTKAHLESMVCNGTEQEKSGDKKKSEGPVKIFSLTEVDSKEKKVLPRSLERGQGIVPTMVKPERSIKPVETRIETALQASRLKGQFKGTNNSPTLQDHEEIKVLDAKEFEEMIKNLGSPRKESSKKKEPSVHFVGTKKIEDAKAATKEPIKENKPILEIKPVIKNAAERDKSPESKYVDLAQTPIKKKGVKGITEDHSKKEDKDLQFSPRDEFIIKEPQLVKEEKSPMKVQVDEKKVVPTLPVIKGDDEKKFLMKDTTPGLKATASDQKTQVLQSLFDVDSDVDKLNKENAHLPGIKDPLENPEKFQILSEDKIKGFPLLSSTREVGFYKGGRLEEVENRSSLELSALPSVSRVLNATMAKSSRQALQRWRTNMIKQLGEKGFQDFYKGQLMLGSEFHDMICQELGGGRHCPVPLSTPTTINCMRSLDWVLKLISDILLLETQVVHPELAYRGVVDCVAKYKNKPVIIEWKRADKAKPLLQSTYDAPVQLCAYLGALNYDPKVNFQVDGGLVVVAYTDGKPADVFQLPLEKCQEYWKVWLDRLIEFNKGQSATPF